MASVYLNIKDTLLQKGFTQLISQVEKLSLCDAPDAAGMTLDDQIAGHDHVKNCIDVGAKTWPLDVRAVLGRQIPAAAVRVFYIGRDRFLPDEKIVDPAEGAKITLTDLENSLLEFLCAQGGETCSKEKLLKYVWEYQENVTTHTVETHIYRLRQKYPVLERRLNTTENGYMLDLKDE